jgi:two-component system, chemotaxis family, protein-glutamate methylesterase/glutaminase
VVTRRPIRVLVVDDSAFARLIISRLLDAEPDIEVVGFAGNGVEALPRIRELKPDVITLDVEMPLMDGVETLKRIMAECPTPTVMLSSLTAAGAAVTLECLAIGAVDFVTKTTSANPVGGEGGGDLRSKIRASAFAKVTPGSGLSDTPTRRFRPQRDIPSGRINKIVVIGSSTGGPKALTTVVPHLPVATDTAYLMVQHMPPGFTGPLAERLDRLSSVRVKEASDGDSILAGQALLAPGGWHMEVQRDGTVSLNESPPIHGVRPAIDMTMVSAVSTYAHRVHSVILTGMGSDGLEGSRQVKRAGGFVVAENELTCVVYGMPKVVIEAGLADRVALLDDVGSALSELLNGQARVA